jgi:glycosyltransferase involved in cell wall biosynthesis
MKILLAIDTLSLGGAERVLGTLARAASGAGLQIALVSITAPEADRGVLLPMLKEAGLNPRSLAIPRMADPRSLRRVAAAIRASRCDVVHAHLAAAATLVPVAASLNGVASVCTFHHVPGPLPRRDAIKERLAVTAAGHSRALLFVSDASRRAFAARYRPDPRTWRVLRNGVDLDDFSPGPAELPSDLRIPAGAPVVTIVGALRRGKGQMLAIKAWPEVSRHHPEARLLLVGTGEMEAALRTRAAALGVADRVVFAGLRTSVSGLLRASTVVALPSEIEALPTTLIEAAGCGLPVVATDVGGTPEVVTHGVTGLLTPPGDADALARAIVDLLGDEGRRRLMGEAARRMAERRFDMHDWARRMAELYRRAAAGLPPPEFEAVQ